MKVVAVAGGTGKLGRTIVEALLEKSEFAVVVFSRKRDMQLERDIGAPIVSLDYNDIASITKTLEDQNVHTLVSAITMGSSVEGTAPPEISLIKGGDASNHVGKLDSAVHILNAHEELCKVTDLQTTYFLNGVFMDYWGPKEKTRLSHFPIVLDIPSNIAAVPGSGNIPVVFTHTIDVAKFVAASLSLSTWEPVTYIMGDKLSWNQVVQLAEEAR
ncbi:hypothetical protein MY11210_003723, partial [Beauveria gryllotalpidicola]